MEKLNLERVPRIVKNSSSTERDMIGWRGLSTGLQAVWLLVWESRCAHPPVPVTHPPWGGLGWGGELCLPGGLCPGYCPRRGKTKCPQRQEDEPTGRRGKRYFLRSSGRKVSSPPLQGTLFCAGPFSWWRKPFSRLLQTERVLGTQLLRKMPGQVLAPWAPQQLSKFGSAHPPHNLAY